LAVGGEYRHVASRAVMNGITGGTWPTVLPISDGTLQKLPIGDAITEESLLTPGGFVRSDTSVRVYLPLEGKKKAYLPHWSYADELGLKRSQRTVSASVLDSYAEVGDLGLFVGCDAVGYVAAQGNLRPVTPAAASGFKVPVLDAATCAILKK